MRATNRFNPLSDLGEHPWRRLPLLAARCYPVPSTHKKIASGGQYGWLDSYLGSFDRLSRCICCIGLCGQCPLRRAASERRLQECSRWVRCLSSTAATTKDRPVIQPAAV